MIDSHHNEWRETQAIPDRFNMRLEPVLHQSPKIHKWDIYWEELNSEGQELTPILRSKIMTKLKTMTRSWAKETLNCMTKHQAQRQEEPSDQDYELPTSMASAQLAADGNRSPSTECLPVEILFA